MKGSGCAQTCYIYIFPPDLISVFSSSSQSFFFGGFVLMFLAYLVFLATNAAILCFLSSSLRGKRSLNSPSAEVVSVILDTVSLESHPVFSPSIPPP